MHDAARALSEVKQTIDQAAKAVDRDPMATCLIAVSKTFEAAQIRPVLDAGHRVFGENRVQEAMGKWPALREEFEGVELHLIGPLQTNKVAEAVATFDAIHSLDRPKLAKKLAAEVEQSGRHPRLFIQVNTGEEDQKAGLAPGEVDGFVALCRIELGLAIEGLMCIPPMNDAPAPHFALLSKIAAHNGLGGLSMGMSTDYVEAVRLGATHVRVGRAIFGERTKSTG